MRSTTQRIRLDPRSLTQEQAKFRMGLCQGDGCYERVDDKYCDGCKAKRNERWGEFAQQLRDGRRVRCKAARCRGTALLPETECQKHSSRRRRRNSIRRINRRLGLNGRGKRDSGEAEGA